MIDSPDTPTPPPVPRRRRTGRRILIVLVLIVIVLPVAAALAAFLTFDPNAYKTQIAAAVAQATGRDVTLAGPLAVKLSWVPTLTARDVRLGNIPGGSTPAMAQIDEIETRVALLPLLQHRLEIQDLVLRHPAVLLERTADGRPNWLFQPAAPAGPSAPPSTPGSPSAGTWHVTVDSLEIVNGAFTYRDAGRGTAATLAVSHADLAAQVSGNNPPAAAPMAVSVDAVWQGVPVGLSGTTGPFAHLTDPTDRSLWPLDLTLSTQGASVAATGTMTDPRQGRGYTIDVHGAVAALEALTPLLPPAVQAEHLSLPPIHGITMTAHLADAGQAAPRVTNLSLQAQGSDLGTTLRGLKLDSLSMITPALDQPATVDILGERNGLAFTLSGSLGPLGALLQPKTALPIDLVLTSAQSNLHMQGSIADPWALRGLNLGLATQVADLGRLSPLAGATLPPVASLTGTAVLSDMPMGLGQGLLLTSLDLTAPQGDLEGAAAVDYGGRTMVTADLRSARLDLDALLGLPSPPPAAPPAVAVPGGLPPPPPPAAVPSAPAPPPEAGPPKRMVIPNLPLPVAQLRSFDGKVNLAFASLRLDGLEYRALVTQVSLLHGLLSVAPSSVVIPGGQMAAAGQLDTRGAIPQASFAMQAPNLAIAPLLGALQMPTAANGLAADFCQPHRIGRRRRRRIGCERQRFRRALPPSTASSTDEPWPPSSVPPSTPHGSSRPNCSMLRDRSRCAAWHSASMRRTGSASVNALVLDTSALLLQGSGSVNFGQESLALALQPNLYLGSDRADGTVSRSPARFGNPHLGKVGSVVINERPDGGQGINGLFQSLVGGKHRPPPVSAACAPALLLARNGQTGPAPDNGDAGLLGKPINLLQQLLHGQ